MGVAVSFSFDNVIVLLLKLAMYDLAPFLFVATVPKLSSSVLNKETMLLTVEELRNIFELLLSPMQLLSIFQMSKLESLLAFRHW